MTLSKSLSNSSRRPQTLHLLPDEILQKIAAQIERNDLLSLSLVSPIVRPIAQARLLNRIIYVAILKERNIPPFKLLRTLRNRPCLAENVKTLGFSMGELDDWEELADYLLSNCSLQHLSVMGVPGKIWEFLQKYRKRNAESGGPGQLKTLALSSFPNHDILINLFNAANRVEDLILDGREASPHYILPDITAHPRLRQICLTGVSADLTIAILNSCANSIQCLKIERCNQPPTVTRLSPLPNLQKLNCQMFVEPDLLNLILDKSPNVNFLEFPPQIVTIQIPGWNFVRSLPPQEPSLARISRHFSSLLTKHHFHSLEHVTLPTRSMTMKTISHLPDGMKTVEIDRYPDPEDQDSHIQVLQWVFHAYSNSRSLHSLHSIVFSVDDKSTFEEEGHERSRMVGIKLLELPIGVEFLIKCKGVPVWSSDTKKDLVLQQEMFDRMKLLAD